MNLLVKSKTKEKGSGKKKFYVSVWFCSVNFVVFEALKPSIHWEKLDRHFKFDRTKLLQNRQSIVHRRIIQTTISVVLSSKGFERGRVHIFLG